MEDNVAGPVAEALYNVLSEFHLLANERLREVRSVYDENSLDRVIFVFDRMMLSVWCDSSNDSIAFKVTPSAEAEIGTSVDTSGLNRWRSLIGKTFGWGWTTINQQGY